VLICNIVNNKEKCISEIDGLREKKNPQFMFKQKFIPGISQDISEENKNPENYGQRKLLVKNLKMSFIT